tara:strand:+ start:88 stop:699 length:612 start_codon:yes stop_codon:yes gene_type:complete
MIYTKEWAFIHIPKTSGTNFQIRMENKEGVTNAYKDFPDREFIVENEKKDLKYLNQHQPLQWWLDRGTLNKEQYIFCFVRNPYARIVSMYNHMLTSGNNPDVTDFKEYVMMNVMDRKTPDSFNFNVGWPQYKFIENNQGINVKYYKIENELPLVEKYIGYTFTDTRYNGRDYDPWHTYYDDETKDKINEKYKEDFIRFNYESF